uniref:Iron ABC transporter permease n=2 Tax=Janibacter limosus TaxID=53458 RepID=A0AC61U921_9MICO
MVTASAFFGVATGLDRLGVGGSARRRHRGARRPHDRHRRWRRCEPGPPGPRRGRGRGRAHRLCPGVWPCRCPSTSTATASGWSGPSATAASTTCARWPPSSSSGWSSPSSRRAASNALAPGSDTATGPGVNTLLLRVTALGAATLLCAAATAAVGPIAFVGLAVPHIVRALVGLDVRRQLLTCLLVGPIVLLGADIIGRVVLRPQELMVGVVTAFVGAPVLLLAVRRLGKRAA